MYSNTKLFLGLFIASSTNMALDAAWFGFRRYDNKQTKALRNDAVQASVFLQKELEEFQACLNNVEYIDDDKSHPVGMSDVKSKHEENIQTEKNNIEKCLKKYPNVWWLIERYHETTIAEENSNHQNRLRQLESVVQNRLRQLESVLQICQQMKNE